MTQALYAHMNKKKKKTFVEYSDRLASSKSKCCWLTELSHGGTVQWPGLQIQRTSHCSVSLEILEERRKKKTRPRPVWDGFARSLPGGGVAWQPG
jgi:hypothetical protein